MFLYRWSLNGVRLGALLLNLGAVKSVTVADLLCRGLSIHIVRCALIGRFTTVASAHQLLKAMHCMFLLLESIASYVNMFFIKVDFFHPPTPHHLFIRIKVLMTCPVWSVHRSSTLVPVVPSWWFTSIQLPIVPSNNVTKIRIRGNLEVAIHKAIHLHHWFKFCHYSTAN